MQSYSASTSIGLAGQNSTFVQVATYNVARDGFYAVVRGAKQSLQYMAADGKRTDTITIDLTSAAFVPDSISPVLLSPLSLPNMANPAGSVMITSPNPAPVDSTGRVTFQVIGTCPGVVFWQVQVAGTAKDFGFTNQVNSRYYLPFATHLIPIPSDRTVLG